MADLLSVAEVLLEGVGEPLRVFDELAFSLLERLLALAAWNIGGDVVDGVQKFLDGTGDVPENKRQDCSSQNDTSTSLTRPCSSCSCSCGCCQLVKMLCLHIGRCMIIIRVKRRVLQVNRFPKVNLTNALLR